MKKDKEKQQQLSLCVEYKGKKGRYTLIQGILLDSEGKIPDIQWGQIKKKIEMDIKGMV